MATLLIIDRLPAALGEQELRELFQPYGEVASAQIVRDTTGDSLGFGFVEMANSVEYDEIRMALDGANIGHHTIHVTVSTGR